jgi:FkbM family methyltransferase
MNRNTLSNFLKNNTLDILVVSRYVSFFILFPYFKADKIFLAAHDTQFINNIGGLNVTTNEDIKKLPLDGVICLTHWHKQIIKQDYPSIKCNISIINNGINPKLFKEKPTKRRNSFIYTSCSYRGLKRLLELWPEIISKIPDATLSLASYLEFPQETDDDRLMSDIIKSRTEITHFGQLNHNELYNLMQTSEYWLYPCCFCETSCVTAMEMLMSEVICLYYPLAGLIDTLGDYGIPVSKGNEVEKILDLSEKEKLEIKSRGKEYALSCSWENRAIEWKSLFELNLSLQKRLGYISNTWKIPTDHVDFIKKLDINPKVIYDIGSCVLHWTNEVKQIFPYSEIILFEAMDEVEFLYKDYRYHLGVLSNSEKEIDFYQNLEHPGGNSYYREIGHPDSEKLFNKSVKKKTSTLSSVVNKNKFPLPDLVKMDVQGCELDILKGGMDVINNAKYLIVELQHTNYNEGAPLSHITIEFLESHGWNLETKNPFCNNGPDGDYYFTKL